MGWIDTRQVGRISQDGFRVALVSARQEYAAIAEIVLGFVWPAILVFTAYDGLGLRHRVTVRQVVTPFSEFSWFYTKLSWLLIATALLTFGVAWDERLTTPVRALVVCFILLATATGILVGFLRGPRPTR